MAKSYLNQSQVDDVIRSSLLSTVRQLLSLTDKGLDGILNTPPKGDLDRTGRSVILEEHIRPLYRLVTKLMGGNYIERTPLGDRSMHSTYGDWMESVRYKMELATMYYQKESSSNEA